MNPLEKYLARQAEPEARLSSSVSGSFAAALVVPALAEEPSLLDGFRPAARTAPGRVLVVLVVNAASDAPAEHRAANARLLAELAPGAAREELAPGVERVADRDFELVVIDRSSFGRELPQKQGVGLARKIGLDLALALHAQGTVASPWLFTTDADVVLPADYFVAASVAHSETVALLRPFRHRGEPGPETDATLRYEAALRYHVLGLAWAGSPYAYHSVGSTLAVRADAYAAVRGVPKRQAGEDFYLLDKLAKIGPIERQRAEPLEIRARRSQRVPFGTGPRVAEIVATGALEVAEPRAFRELRVLLEALRTFSMNRVNAVAVDHARSAGVLSASAREELWLRAGVFEASRAAAREVGSGDLLRRLMTWFDGLRTLKFLHAVRDAGLSDVPLSSALESAPFCALPPDLPPEASLSALRELEARLPPRIGPALER